MAQNPPRVETEIEPFVSEVTAQPGSLEQAASTSEILSKQLEEYLSRFRTSLIADLKDIIDELP